MARPTLLIDDLGEQEVKPRARPAIPLITPAPSAGSSASGMSTDAGGSAGNLGGLPAPAPGAQPSPAPAAPGQLPIGGFPLMAGMEAARGIASPIGGQPAAPTLNTALSAPTPQTEAARLMSSPNPTISGPMQDAARMQQRQQVVDSANTGGSYGYAVSPGGYGLTPQQAVGMGFVPQPSNVTAPNMAYGGPQQGPAFTGFAPTMSIDEARKELAAGGRGLTPEQLAARRTERGLPPLVAGPQPGQRGDESPEEFAQRRKDVAASKMANSDLESRQARARQAKSLLSSQARQIAKAGDTKSAAALFSQVGTMETPSRTTPYSVARTREEDATKRTVGKDGDSTKLQVSRDTTERERMRQEGLNTRAERKQTFDQTMADNKARLAGVSEGNKTRATGLIRQIETIGRQIQKQEEYVGGKESAAAETRIKALETNRQRVQDQLDAIFGESGEPGAAGGPAVTPPSGRRFTSANAPPPQQRQVGDEITTDRGTFTWNGSGWIQKR